MYFWHIKGTLAHPTVEGFDIPPGLSVSLAVKGRENQRMSLPHGNCTDKLSGLNHINYTLVDCQNLCIQRKIMNECHCIDNRLGTPLDDDFKQGLKFCNELPPDLPPITPHCAYEPDPECDLMIAKASQILSKWRAMNACYRKVYNDYAVDDPTLIESCNCFPPCHDFVYDVSYSMSTLPEKSGEHAQFYGIVDKFSENLPPEKQQILNATYGENYRDILKANISRLTVYIADSNILKTTEMEDYEQTRLLSDIGGQLGLWIGISIITLFEVLMLGVNIFSYCTYTQGAILRKSMSHSNSNNISHCLNIDQHATTSLQLSHLADVRGSQSNKDIRYEIDILTSV